MKEFTNYNQALALKELGFDEPCIYAWCNKGGWNKYQMVKEPIVQVLRTDGNPFGKYFNGKNWNVEYSQNKNKIQCSAPTYSQAFRWFREKHKLHSTITSISQESWQWHITRPGESLGKLFEIDFYSHEEAESSCLDKLIEIVKDKQ